MWTLCQTEEQREIQRGKQLLQQAQAEQGRMFHKLHALEQVRELGGVCAPRSTSPAQCGGRFLLMRPVFVERDLHSWTGLGGQLAAIARGVRPSVPAAPSVCTSCWSPKRVPHPFALPMDARTCTTPHPLTGVGPVCGAHSRSSLWRVRRGARCCFPS